MHASDLVTQSSVFFAFKNSSELDFFKEKALAEALFLPLPAGKCDSHKNTVFHCVYALVIGFPEGGRDPGLMWGLSKLYISKFLYFPTPRGFFPCEAKHPTGFRTLFWFFEQLANTH